MFITYSPDSPTIKEIQYILDGSNTLKNIQGKVVLPLPKGVNPLEVYQQGDISTRDPIDNLKTVLGYTSCVNFLASDKHWSDPDIARATFIAPGYSKSLSILNQIAVPMSIYSIVACLGVYGSDGCTLSTILDLSKIKITTTVTRDPDGGGSLVSTIATSSPKVSIAHSTPFVFVTAPDTLAKNPPITTFKVDIGNIGSETFNLLYFGVLYNS